MLNRLRLELNGDQEDKYRQFHLPKDIKQARIAILLFAVPLFSFAFNDYQLFGLSSEFYSLVALRFGLLFYSIFELIQIGTVKSYRTYDRSITVYSLVILICSGIINATRPQNFIVQVLLTIIALFVICLITPNRFVNQVLLSSIAVIGEAAIVIWFLRPSPITDVFTIFFSLILAYVIALSGSWQLQAYRRKSFQDLTKNIELQNELEKHSKNLEKLVEEKTVKLRKSERMATIGELAGMVGHDLRNPLTSISGATYYLKKKTGSRLNEKEKEMIATIERSVDNSNKIISDLLDYSREINLNRSETDPKSLLEETLTLLEVPEKITLANNTETEPKFAVDKDKMQRVFVNLIRNALDAMPNGGTLTIKSERVENSVAFSFADTGEGMNEDTLQKLWTPLFTTKARGMGLGLPICKRFVEAHNGTIAVSSIPNKGSIFTVNLPIQN
jgi:signal transduction histidine kinase